jgi:Fe-S-cluster-containing dehydrogenase component/CRP-like cAMP-binding protein
MIDAERTESWPERVWDAAIVRGLDERGRREIEAAGRLRTVRAGEVLFRSGDFADAVFLVASGSCALFGLRRGERERSVVRRVMPAGTFGEEASVFAFATRQFEARCEVDGVLAEVPFPILKRAVVRTGGADALARIERALRRAAARDFLRTVAFAQALSESELEVLLDAVEHVRPARGEHVYRQGDAKSEVYLVADGLLQVETRDEGKRRIEAYLARGDVFGDDDVGRVRGLGVVANGPAWLLSIPRTVFMPLARRHSGLLDGARRLRKEDEETAFSTNTTAHVFQDLYRLRVARSLLVIDQDACIRCGHCAWSCASVHDDGVSRLVRHGDKIVVQDGTASRRQAPLLVPNSCQHCKNPSCMIDCPTGAIGRDARGEVFIREDLCTGCGSCARGCPWDNIQMAARTDAAAYPSVAVKCDLCSGVASGPACVASCPTQAIARIDPNEVLVELRTSARGPERPAILPARTPSWPWVLGAALFGLGTAGYPMSRFTSGIGAGIALGLLALYSVAKRVALGGRQRSPLVTRIASLRAAWPVSRWLYIGHVSLGALACGLVLGHVGGRLSGSAGSAVAVAFAIAAASGALGALLGRVAPPAISRVEKKSRLVEELRVRQREIDDEVFALLSGKSELVKLLFRKLLAPYSRSTFGPLRLLFSRRTRREEERTLRARVDALTGGKTGESMAGIDELVRLVVEHRALRLERWLSTLLRGWILPHLAATAGAIVLLVFHVFAVVRR